MVDCDENGDETQKPTEWQGADVEALLPRSGLVQSILSAACGGPGRPSLWQGGSQIARLKVLSIAALLTRFDDLLRQHPLSQQLLALLLSLVPFSVGENEGGHSGQHLREGCAVGKASKAIVRSFSDGLRTI